jgi:hypothetical protein
MTTTQQEPEETVQISVQELGTLLYWAYKGAGSDLGREIVDNIAKSIRK